MYKYVVLVILWLCCFIFLARMDALLVTTEMDHTFTKLEIDTNLLLQRTDYLIVQARILDRNMYCLTKAINYVENKAQKRIYYFACVNILPYIFNEDYA